MNSLPMTAGFSPGRFKQITRRFLILNKKSYALAFGGVFIGLYALWVFQVIYMTQPSIRATIQFIVAAGVMIYQIGGLFLTSAIFKELQTSSSASQMLTLPATTGEKLMAAWTTSFLLFTLASFLTITLLLYLTTLSANLFLDAGISGSVGWRVTDPINIALTYLIFNSIFLLGSVFFKGRNFLKTVLSIVVFMLGSSILLIGIINYIGLESFEFTLSSLLFFSSSNPLLVLLSQLLVYVPISALFLILSYYKLKNRQVV